MNHRHTEKLKLNCALYLSLARSEATLDGDEEGTLEFGFFERRGMKHLLFCCHSWNGNMRAQSKKPSLSLMSP
jgi:hypothetical protein